MNRILITGGAGFIASELAKKLLEDENNYVVILDNLLTGHLGKLPAKSERFKFIKSDVNDRSDLSDIMTSFSFDYVFHYAAVVGVQRTLDHPLLVLDDIKGIRNILELSKNTGVKRVFFSSSSEVYGEPVEFPQHEDTTPLNSKLPYAIVKNVGEAMVKSFYQEHGLEYMIFRFFNTYGSFQSKDFVISKFLLAAQKNEDITIYGDGSQTRTFCHIDDNIEATTKMAFSDKFVNQVVNIGNDLEIPVKDLAERIIKITNSKSQLVYLPPLKSGDMKRRQPDNSKMRSILNRELITLEEGISKILEEGLFEHKLSN